MRRLLPFLSACVLLLVVSACGEEPQLDPSTGDPTKVEFDSDLGVDLAAMNRSETGLYMQDLVMGTGIEATTGRTIIVHYTGWLPDGTRFGTSREDDRATAFVLSDRQLIKGWAEGLVGMKEGGKRRLVVPSDLAYGAEGRPGIPPYSVLVFEVELFSVR
ncbi:FKBP-type peptidyl-prolyl cis-trans isomerase [Archangium sp.]|uniref:FKBP-type peptidyl-prolyl cis-trans isomerase n=1 Tax=Archangium sp. TaxID=1872627 RepID=UPI00286B98B1|nr:FKBP-type peptidyl-prolyl cis-trans isomerase [Archangium sp.]